MGDSANRRAMEQVAARRVWLLVLVPALTLGAVAAGVPLWAQMLLILAQAGLIWVALRRPAQTGTAPLSRLRGRDDLQTLLQSQGLETTGGLNGAALAIRLDDAEALRRQLSDGDFHTVMDALGERLSRSLREDDLFCRLDPDGFGVALHPQRALDLAGVMAIAQRLQARLGEALTLHGQTLRPGVSIGFCLSPRSAMLNGLSMLEAAESAAAMALRAGPGGLTSYSVVDFPVAVSGERIAALRRALDNGEIRAHFQPQICAETGAVSGLEALARWHHPQSGVLSPADFLPQIEAAGLSPRLAETMLRDALTTLRRLDEQGLSVPSVSINLSAEELRNPRLADEIAWELDSHDMPPERLTLEILETVVAGDDDDIAVRNIARLAAMGCGIDLDDFGTGQASIANMRRFAVGRIKIDRSFVSNLHEDAEQARMVAAILSMAGQLGLETLAEGVEQAGERERLTQLGCGHLQGYGIARPMPVGALTDWLRDHAAALEQETEQGTIAAQPRAAAGGAGE